MHTQTIFALSTPKGKGGIAVIRVSGPDALKSGMIFTGVDIFKPRMAKYVNLINPVSRETIDHALLTFFSAPHSFTGEDVIEYAVHGSPAIIQELLTCLGACEGHRMAEPGEFTRRAFENDKLDLTEAEAVADLINAETVMQKNQALSQLSGHLSHTYMDWTERLKRTIAHCEANLEFPDEDLPDELGQTCKPQAQELLKELEAHLNDGHRGERIRDGIQIAVIGAPNAGKSSLVNTLAKRDIAIVSDIAGTTRDVIEAHLDIGGYPVTLIDTAGLRPLHLHAEGHDHLENEGIALALDRAEKADFRMIVFDAGQTEKDPHTFDLIKDQDIIVLNKIDRGQGFNISGGIQVSARTGEGLEELISHIQNKLQSHYPISEGANLTRARHREALEESTASIKRALQTQEEELFCEDLRLALRAIGKITGRVVNDQILDVVFRDFCIGK